MQYRDFGQLAFKPSALGFGAMRLPVLLDDEGKPDFKRIDYSPATEMLHRAVDGGVNYVDTAWTYHEDSCEAWLGEALKGGYRERVRLATKMPVWSVEKPADFDRILGKQLERLQTDHIDCYLLHSLDEAHWKCVVEQDQLAGAERALADGRIGHLGFTFHGAYEDFAAILAATDLGVRPDPVQLHGRGVPGRPQGARAGGRQGLGVIVMEPVRGGALARNVPPQVQAVWDRRPSSGRRRVGAPVGLESPRGVVPAQRHEHDGAGRAEPAVRGPLAPGLLTARTSRWWPACATCTASSAYPVHVVSLLHAVPAGRGDPGCLRALQRRPHVRQPARQQMATRCPPTIERADRCTACGDCVEKCPQGIAVPEWLEKAQSFLVPC